MKRYAQWRAKRMRKLADQWEKHPYLLTSFVVAHAAFKIHNHFYDKNPDYHFWVNTHVYDRKKP